MAEEWCLNWGGWTGEEVRVHFKTSITKKIECFD